MKRTTYPYSQTSPTPPSIVVYGPQGCGKTLNSERLKNALGLSQVVDGWQFGFSKNWPRQGALLLTNVRPPAHFRYPVMSYAEALRRAAS